MARRIFRKIDGYLSYKYFSRISREKYKQEYKDRTGAETARGWNNSPEYSKFLNAEKQRVITYAERRPDQFIQKKDTILKYSNLDLSQDFTYSDKPSPGGKFLNPMKGKWGPEKLTENLRKRAEALGKDFIVINRVQAPNKLGGDKVFTTDKQGQAVRGDMMRRFGRIADRNKKYGQGSDDEMIGANYAVETVTTGNTLLAIIDTEIFLY